MSKFYYILYDQEKKMLVDISGEYHEMSNHNIKIFNYDLYEYDLFKSEVYKNNPSIDVIQVKEILQIRKDLPLFDFESGDEVYFIGKDIWEFNEYFSYSKIYKIKEVHNGAFLMINDFNNEILVLSDYFIPKNKIQNMKFYS